MPREIVPANEYKDKLVKLIPTEVVGAYLFIDGVLPPTYAQAGLVAILTSGFLFVITPFYLHKLYGVTSKSQIVFTTLSFVVWLYCLGGPFKYYQLHVPFLGSIALALWTLLIPFFVQTDARPSGSGGPRPDEPVSEWHEGVSVILPAEVQPAWEKASVLLEWNPGMTLFQGHQATITSVHQNGLLVKVDADNGQNWWAIDWITKA